MERSDSLNIDQMDVFFVDLCSFYLLVKQVIKKKTHRNLLSTQSESGYR